jgi:alpha-N-acetylglucosamine transferase
MSVLKKYGKTDPLFTSFFTSSFTYAYLVHRCHTRTGGIYLDTDAFPTHSLDSLRIHPFTLSFDNIINQDPAEPKRLNNGVFLSEPNAAFLNLWEKEYANFDPTSFAHHSSNVPYILATQFPDLIHVEFSRISPISYGFQTAEAAAGLTC